jgi:hypothetical protein
MSVPEIVVQDATYHTQLECVPAALIQQESCIADLENKATQGVKKIKLLETNTKKELEEHNDLRDTSAWRLAAKLRHEG